MRSLLNSLAIGTIALSLGGCAGLQSLSSDVSTYGQWPAGRAPGSYVFERLPSQQVEPERQQQLEDAARGAIEAAGFKPADTRAAADVTVQLGARVEAADRSPFDDPFWWNDGMYGSRFGYGAFGGWRGMGWGLGFGRGFGYGPGFDARRYEREVVVLIRDRPTGAPLYEARAGNAGVSPSIDWLLGAMFEAALQDFPNGDAKPRRVTVPMAH